MWWSLSSAFRTKWVTKWPSGSDISVSVAIHRFVWHVEQFHGGVRLVRQESFDFGMMRGRTNTAFMPARQREMTWRYVKLLMFLITLHFQKCTEKIKTLLSKKSKFHFVQYWKQRVPCESTDKGVSSRGSRVRTKFYRSIIDSGSDRVLTMYNSTIIYTEPFLFKKISLFMCLCSHLNVSVVIFQLM